MKHPTSETDRTSRAAELVILFLLLPVLMAVWLPRGWLFPVLGAFTLAGAILLTRTAGFRWRDLISGWREVAVFPVLGVILVTAGISWLVMTSTRPEALFFMIRQRPEFMLVIALLYPILSALPQEVLFRPLWFRRYGDLLPGGAAGLVLNAAAFSFAHLMYWSWIVASMTFTGGLVFAWAYEVKKSFPLAVVLHSVAGIVLFAFGMGVYFYSGAVERPF